MEVITSKLFCASKLSVVIDLFIERQQLSKKFESLLADMEVLSSGPREQNKIILPY